MVRLIREEEPPTAEHAAEHLGRPAEDRGGPEDRAGAAVEAGARRTRLDCDEVPGEGPDAALRDGQRAGAGHRALPDDEAVEACPPSAWYRFRKLARRNRVALTTAALVVAALVLGTAVSLWQAVRDAS